MSVVNYAQKQEGEQFMKYQEFCSEFKKGVLANKEWKIKEENYKFYPDGYIAANKEELDFIRITNEKHHGIKADILKGDFAVLRIEKGNDELVDSRYSLRDLYDVYKQDDWVGVWQVIDDHMKILKPFKNQNLTFVFDSYENAKDHLLIRAINFTDNEAQLEQHVYRRFADIALVVYVVLYDNVFGFGSAKLPKSTMETWEKDSDEIFEEAFENTMKMMPPRLYENPWEAMENDPEIGRFMDDEPVLRMARKAIPLVKTTKNLNGAIAMFYPGVKERIAEMFDGSYYVAFTSIHEARVHRVGSMPPYRIKNSLDDVNETFPKEELLSREVFLYNAKERTFDVLEM